ncbi:uncharacterized, partial [Tachysurus ichikawai]
ENMHAHLADDLEPCDDCAAAGRPTAARLTRSGSDAVCVNERLSISGMM